MDYRGVKNVWAAHSSVVIMVLWAGWRRKEKRMTQSENTSPVGHIKKVTFLISYHTGQTAGSRAVISCYDIIEPALRINMSYGVLLQSIGQDVINCALLGPQMSSRRQRHLELTV